MCFRLVVLLKWCLLLKRESFSLHFQKESFTPNYIRKCHPSVLKKMSLCVQVEVALEKQGVWFSVKQILPKNRTQRKSLSISKFLTIYSE